MQLAAAEGGIPATARRIDAARELVPADVVDAHVGSRIRARRVEVGLSQAALGRHLGLTFSQVQKYEKGLNRIGAGRLYRLAALLGVPIQYFFDELDAPRPEPVGKAELLRSADAARLQAAFDRIRDPDARQALISLASSMVEDT